MTKIFLFRPERIQIKKLSIKCKKVKRDTQKKWIYKTENKYLGIWKQKDNKKEEWEINLKLVLWKQICYTNLNNNKISATKSSKFTE